MQADEVSASPDTWGAVVKATFLRPELWAQAAHLQGRAGGWRG